MEHAKEILPIRREALAPSAVMGLFALSYGGLVSFVPIFAPERGLPGSGWLLAVYATPRGFYSFSAHKPRSGVAP